MSEAFHGLRAAGPWPPFIPVCKPADDVSAWLDFRRSGIGSSEAAAVLGVGGYGTRLEVWGRKTGQIPDSTPSEPMIFGRLMEPVIMSETARRVGLPVFEAQVLVRSVDRPFMLATPDAFLGDVTETDLAPVSSGVSYIPETASVRAQAPVEECRECLDLFDRYGPGLCEAKATNAYLGAQWADGPPDDKAVQVCHQLRVLGLKWGILAVVIGGNQYGHHHLELDGSFDGGDGLVEAERKFWEENVVTEVPPMGGDEDPALLAETYRVLYPHATGETIELPGEALDVHLERLEANADRLAAQKRADAAKVKLQGWLKDNAFGTLPDGFGGYSWLSQPRAAYTVPAKPDLRVLRHLKPKTAKGKR